jgi:hypothetical protein
MRNLKPSLSVRFERLARWQRLRSGLLLAGLVTALLGGYLLSLTLRYTPEQMIAILLELPKSPQRFSVWFPAPSEFRFLGAALMAIGVALVVCSQVRTRRKES